MPTQTLAIDFDDKGLSLAEAVEIFPRLMRGKGGAYFLIAKQVFAKTQDLPTDKVFTLTPSKFQPGQIKNFVAFTNKYLKDQSSDWRINYSEDKAIFGLYNRALFERNGTTPHAPRAARRGRRLNPLLSLEDFTAITLKTFHISKANLREKMKGGKPNERWKSILAYRRAFAYVGRAVANIPHIALSPVIGLTLTNSYNLASHIKAETPEIKLLTQAVKREIK